MRGGKDNDMAKQGPEISDPIAAWREWLGQSERQWNAFLNEAMATEQFGQSMASSMDAYLNMQKTMNEAFGRYFTALNIPTRSDVLGLGDRLSVIEDRLASIEALLTGLTRSREGEGSDQSIPRPPRTKRPGTDG
jgi:polyhydroxyalkanoic acid synthase PhaR subunit